MESDLRRIEVRLLGPLEVSVGDGPVSIGGRKEQALVAMLATNRNRVVPVDTMIDELWGDDPPPTATKTLRSYISRIRTRLGSSGSIATDGGGYRMDLDEETLDTARFETLLATAASAAGRGDHVVASEHLATALALWRGRALAGLDDHPFAQLEAARLEERRLEALERKIASDLEAGRHQQLVAELEQLVGLHPLREHFWRALMLALYRSGRQADALRAYQAARQTLGEELGIEPTRDLRALEEAILLHDESLSAPAAAPRDTLPRSRDSFVGRQREVTEILHLADAYRCVTLTGVGGTGKTRLGVEAARQALERHPDGTMYIELAAITDADAVAEHVLLSFGEPGSHTSDPTAALIDHVGRRRVRVVLDNCEHLVASVAELVDRLLESCDEASVLATSREPLGVRGEAVFHVPPLGIPAVGAPSSVVESSASVQLFVDRVRSHRHEFRLTEHNSDAVATVCRTLDGLPLALELAAARARTMDVVELASRIGDRFTVLNQGRRTAPPRRQTLRAAIEWSYDLLSPAGRQMLRRLAAFAGTWGGDDAHAVTADGATTAAATTDLIGELVDKSLVELVPHARYRLLETVRQFAFDELVVSGEAPAIGRRHRDWYATRAAESDRLLRGSRQQETWHDLEADHDNLRAAIQWSLDNDDTEGALGLVADLAWFWFVRGYWREAWRWLTRSLDAAGGSELARARAATHAGAIEIIRANAPVILDSVEAALETFRAAGEQAEEAWARLLIGYTETATDSEGAETTLREALATFEAIGDEWSAAFTRRYLGDCAATPAERVAHHEASLDGFLRLGDRWNAAFTLYNLGGVLLADGELGPSKEASNRARAMAREIGDRVWDAHATKVLGMAEYLDGDDPAAARLLGEALETLRLIGDDTCTAMTGSFLSMAESRRGNQPLAAEHAARSLRIGVSLGGLRPAIYLRRAGLVMLAAGEPRAAARFVGAAAAALPESHPAGAFFETREQLGELRDRLEAALGPEPAATLRDEGAADDFERLITEALDRLDEIATTRSR